MSSLDDDLIREFRSGLPERVASATDLWLEFEEGTRPDMRALKRLLHTLKGEAHMLGLEEMGELGQAIEEVVVRVDSSEQATEVGDVVLEGLETLSLLAASEPDPEEPFDVAPILASLREAADGLGERKEASPPADATAETKAEPTSRDSTPPDASLADPEALQTSTLGIEDVQPVVHELQRLFGEAALLQPELREVQRMVRAVVAEMDPTLPPEVLHEQVVKTLGYAAEIERKLTAVRQQWSANAFASKVVLDQLADATQRAAVVSVGRLRGQLAASVRTTAKVVGKQVQLHLEGDAYIDAQIARRLESALLHSVRNAVDHGIEAPEVRAARGKPEKGSIRVSIEQLVSTVVVTVEDDGGGVDLEALRKRLDAGPEISERDLLRSLFRTGLSTRDEATSISGRGVGLDVVAREVIAVGGSYDVASTFGEGFRLRLTLPTVLRADVVVPIMVRNQRYAVPGRHVVTFSRLGEIERTTDGLRVRLQLAEGSELLPVRTLGAILGDDRPPEAGDRAVVLRYEDRRVALVVDNYGNPRALPFQPADELAFRSALIRGVAPTPEGGVRLLLDIQTLMNTVSGQVAPAAGRRERRVPRVTVVEDAPVARELLCGILRSFGLEVREAADGREGLRVIREHHPDLVLTDIEMPFVGGLEMVGELRQDPQYADLPVIVLSTDTSEPTKRRAAALGVVAFLSKQRFVESELRELVDRCLRRR